MDKLSRYNQKLLAITGTIVLATIIILIIFGIGSLIFQTINSYNNDDNALRAQTEKITSDSSQIIRTQSISFAEPIQLDTSQAKFIVPVGQVNLLKPEKDLIRTEKTSLLRLSPSSSYYYESYYGQYNNFIYFDHDKNFKKMMFDKRIAITHWAFLQQNGLEILLFKGAGKDNNVDEKLDEEDQQTLFAYFIAEDRLINFPLNNGTVINFEPLQKTDLVYVTVGIDKNNDQDYDSNHEPQQVMVLNLQTKSLEDLIPEDMQIEIQRLVDGV